MAVAPEDLLMSPRTPLLHRKAKPARDERAVVAFQWPTLGVVARLVAPTLGGVFLGGLLMPAWVAGCIAGGALGLLAGVAREREVASAAG